GVKKDIEQLERQLRPKPEPAPKTKTTKPRTRKPAAKPAARRGRPPKTAKAAG
ncbi:terminase, partial [Enterobacter hormaechei subsp. xiangfangensis]